MNSRIALPLCLALVACGGSKNTNNTPQDMTMTSNADMARELDPCAADCVEGESGAELALAFFDCANEACKQHAPGSNALDACINAATDPANPDSPCVTARNACFSGSVGGCKELALHVEATCTPNNLPIPEDDMFFVTYCVLSEGWKGAPSAQLKAWPLFTCVFLDESNGCLEACRDGGAACRTCAASKCKADYDACVADTGTETSTDLPAEKISCQTVGGCLLQCG
jgi:hypothetical protein